ncbi:MAG: TIGR04283 family arsenosugar biosynthesis glycosyltransferase [Pseudomonadota bacterium]
MLSIVIPTLNAAEDLPRTLTALVPGAVEGLVKDVVIADGGSSDATAAIAEEAGATFVSAAPGRGSQLRAGADMAKADWFLFLHADTALADGWVSDVRRTMSSNPDAAGVFRFVLDDVGFRARTVEKGVRIRCAFFGLPYGDQGLLISRRHYLEVGGYEDLPLMEDIDLVRRIGRRRLVLLDTAAVTSAVRYRRDGYIKRVARNATCLAMFFAGFKPQTIVRLYG